MSTQDNEHVMRRAVADFTKVASIAEMSRLLHIDEHDVRLAVSRWEKAGHIKSASVDRFLITEQGRQEFARSFGLPGVYVYQQDGAAPIRELWLNLPGSWEGNPSNMYDCDVVEAEGEHLRYGKYERIQVRRRYKPSSVDGIAPQSGGGNVDASSTTIDDILADRLADAQQYIAGGEE